MQGISLIKPHYPQYSIFYTFGGNKLIGLKDDNLKLILNLDKKTEQVFELLGDPDEKKNLYENYKDNANIKYYENILKGFTKYQIDYLDSFNQ